MLHLSNNTLTFPSREKLEDCPSFTVLQRFNAGCLLIPKQCSLFTKESFRRYPSKIGIKFYTKNKRCDVHYVNTKKLHFKYFGLNLNHINNSSTTYLLNKM